MLPLSTPSPLCSCSFKQTLLSCAFSLSHFLADSLAHSLTLSVSLFLALRVAYLWLSHFANGISFYDKWLVIIKVARSAVFGPAAKSPLARLLLLLQRNDLSNRMRKREREYECKYRKLIMCSRRFCHCHCHCCPAAMSCTLFSLLRLNDFCQVPAGCASCPGQASWEWAPKRKQHKKRKRIKIKIENCAELRRDAPRIDMCAVIYSCCKDLATQTLQARQENFTL